MGDTPARNAGDACDGAPRSGRFHVLPHIVRRDRKVAWAVGSVVLLGFLAASAITVYNAHQRTSDPPVSVTVVERDFEFPRMVLCPEVRDEFSTLSFTEPGPASEAFCQWTSDVDDPNVVDAPLCTATVDAENACFTAHTEEAVVTTAGTQAGVNIPFNATLSEPNDPIDPARTHRGRPRWMLALLYRIDPETGDVDERRRPTRLYVPFSSEVSVVVRPTVTTRIDGEVEWAYAVTSTSAQVTGPNTDKAPFTNEVIFIRMRSDNHLVTEVTEHNPTDPLVLVGVIAGFWGIAVTVFNVLFVGVDTDVRKAMWRKPVAEQQAAGASSLESAVAERTSSSTSAVELQGGASA